MTTLHIAIKEHGKDVILAITRTPEDPTPNEQRMENMIVNLLRESSERVSEMAKAFRADQERN